MELLSRTCKTESMNVERIIARLFVVLGGLFWIFMLWGSQTGSGYSLGPLTSAEVKNAIGTAAIPLVLTVIVFVLGLFFERLTALVLLVAAAAVVIWGIIAAWESGVWMMAIAFLIAPMLIAAALYWLAGRMQQICLMEEGSS